jgi:hypothetical protein
MKVTKTVYGSDGWIKNQLPIDERKDMIILYARKCVMYPKGSSNYDPVDMMNLEHQIKKLDELILNNR